MFARKNPTFARAYSGWPDQLKSSNCPPSLSRLANKIDGILCVCFCSEGKVIGREGVGKTGFVISLSPLQQQFSLSSCLSAPRFSWRGTKRECVARPAQVGRGRRKRSGERCSLQCGGEKTRFSCSIGEKLPIVSRGPESTKKPRVFRTHRHMLVPRKQSDSPGIRVAWSNGNHISLVADN